MKIQNLPLKIATFANTKLEFSKFQNYYFVIEIKIMMRISPFIDCACFINSHFIHYHSFN